MAFRKLTPLVVVLVITLLAVPVGAKIKLTTVTHWNLSTGPGALLVEYINEYNAMQDEVEIEVFPDSAAASLDKVILWSATDTMPDILPVSQVNFVDLMQAGIMVPLPDYAVQSVQESYVAGALDMVRFGDQVWGYPSEYIPMVFTYDTVAFTERGLSLDFPDTWPDLVETAKKLTILSDTGDVSKAGLGWTNDYRHNVGIFLALTWTSGEAGSEIFSEDARSIDLLTPAAQFSLEFLDQLFNRENVARWGSNRVLANHSIRWTPSHHRRTISTFPGRLDEVRSARVPQGEDGRRLAPVYGWAYTVPAAAKHPREAHEFLMWLTSDVLPDGTTRLGNLMMELGSIPGTRADLLNQTLFRDEAFYTGYIDAVANNELRPWPTSVSNSQLWTELNASIAAVIRQQQAPIQALAQAQTLTQAILDEGLKE